MQLISIVENTSKQGLPIEHGLSLYITLKDKTRILFDMGQGTLFSENAARLGVSIEDIDVAVISHGHYDHGGGIRTFLKENSKAKIYVHQNAFQPHYSLRENGLHYIGLEQELKENKRIVFCHEKALLSPHLTLIGNISGCILQPAGNRLLLGPEKDIKDNFCHEQSLIIKEDNNLVLIAGCAHKGIVNIIQKVKETFKRVPTHVVAGFHLVKSGLTIEEEETFIGQLATILMKYNCQYYTMHCTGISQYEKLKQIMGNKITYLSCGECIEID